MREDETQEPPTETVSLGGTTGGGRLAARIKQLSSRQQGTVIAGSTLLLGVVVLTTIVWSRGQTETPAEPALPAQTFQPPAADSSPSETTLEGGSVWVGYHDVMLALPRAWVHSNSKTCGTTTRLPAPPPRAPHSKCSAHSPRQRSIVLWLRQDVERSELLDNGFHESVLDGRSLLTGPIQKAGPAYLQYVALPDTDTLVVVRSPDRKLATELVASVRGVPATWVTVPDLRGQDPQQALHELEEFDLLGRADHNSGMTLPANTLVVNQNPAEGQIVSPGTAVTIAVLPASVASVGP